MTEPCWALRALILLALDANQGHWLTLDRLARRVLAPAARVDATCGELIARNLMVGAIVDGKPCFGVGVDESSAVLA
jgi:hypothetical protein